jgi:hypothetical protein
MGKIDSFRLEAKYYLSENSIRSVNYIEEYLDISSDKYNNFILLKEQYNRILKEINSNTLNNEEKNLALNKINGSLLYFIDSLTEKDIGFKKEIVIKIPASTTQIIIRYGDIFNSEGLIAIPVSQFFAEGNFKDLISKKSLQAQMIQNYFSAFDEYKIDVLNVLDKSELIFSEKIRDHKIEKRYEIGSTIFIQASNKLFGLFALTQTEIIQYHTDTNATVIDLWKALIGFLSSARNFCQGMDINIPLIGSGISGIGLPYEKLIEINLIAILEETKKNHITNTIKMFIHPSLEKEINLLRIEQNWKL